MTAGLKKWQYGNDNRVLKPPCVSHVWWWIGCCSVHSWIITGERHQCKLCIKAPKDNTEKRFSMPTTPSSLKLHTAKTIRTFTFSGSATVILFTHSSLRQQALIYYFNPAFKKVMIQFYCWHESKFEFKSEPQKTILSWAKISGDRNESTDHILGTCKASSMFFEKLWCCCVGKIIQKTKYRWVTNKNKN